MVRIVRSDRRDLKPFDVVGAKVHVSDPIVGKDDCLAAGFTEYVAPSRFEWTFDYNEVFYVLDGSLQVQEVEAPSQTRSGRPGLHRKGNACGDHSSRASVSPARHPTSVARLTAALDLALQFRNENYALTVASPDDSDPNRSASRL